MNPAKYPSSLALSKTYRKQKTSLDGARSFLAGENVIITADDRNALAKAGGRVVLRPSATRRLGNYLDQSALSVSGWTVQESPLGESGNRNLFTNESGDTYEKFIDATAEVSTTLGASATHLRNPLCEDPDAGFDHGGILTYWSLYTIDGGERLQSEQDVRLCCRRGSNRAHVIAVMRHDKEKRVVQEWLTEAAMLAGLAVQPFRLKEDLPERHDEVREILGRLGDDLLATRHPKFFEPEGALAPTASDPTASKPPYYKFKRKGSDSTWMVDIDTVLAECEEHNMRLGSINVLLFSERERGGSERDSGFVELRLRQEPRKDDALRVSWVAGRAAPTRPSSFTDDDWSRSIPCDWVEEQKRAYLLSAWERIAQLPANTVSSLRQTA